MFPPLLQRRGCCVVFLEVWIERCSAKQKPLLPKSRLWRNKELGRKRCLLHDFHPHCFRDATAAGTDTTSSPGGQWDKLQRANKGHRGRTGVKKGWGREKSAQNLIRLINLIELATFVTIVNFCEQKLDYHGCIIALLTCIGDEWLTCT